MKNRIHSLLILFSALSAVLYAEGSAFAQTPTNGYYYAEPTYGRTTSPDSQNVEPPDTFSPGIPVSSNGFYHSNTSTSSCSGTPNYPYSTEANFYNQRPFRWLNKISLEATVGWGYLYYNSLKIQGKNKDSELKEVLRKAFNWGTNLALTISNFNGEVFLHFPVAKYYSIGLGAQSFFLSSAFVSIDNRFRIPLSSGNAIFFDFPVGVNVTHFPEKKPVISAGARTGIILMGQGHFGFIMHLGTEGIFIPQKKGYSTLLSARAGLGLLIAP